MIPWWSSFVAGSLDFGRSVLKLGVWGSVRAQLANQALVPFLHEVGRVRGSVVCV